MKRLILSVLILALALVATVGAAPGTGSSYRITLLQPSVVNGTVLKPGDYKLDVANQKITISGGKQSIEAGVTIENGNAKFERTAVRYNQENGALVLSEIRLGGTTTKILFTR